MKTKKEIEKALENCKKVRMAKRPKKSLCPLFPGAPICMNCTFTSVIEWIQEIDKISKVYRECLKKVFKLDKILYSSSTKRGKSMGAVSK